VPALVFELYGVLACVVVKLVEIETTLFEDRFSVGADLSYDGIYNHIK